MNQIIDWQKIDIIDSITPQDFEQNYFSINKPLVIKQISKNWPALKKWSPDYFKEKYGNNIVKVYDNSFLEPGENYMASAKKMLFSEYLDEVFIKGKNLRMFLYNIVSHAPELKKDVSMPQLVKGFSKNFFFMFFGPKGTVTQNHYDIDMSHVFHTNFYGKKRFILFPPSESKKLYQHPFTIRSYVDIDKPDLVKFPNFKGIKAYEVFLDPGDTLYIPSTYWHHVNYIDASFAISFRVPHQKMLKRFEGFFNILVMQMIDRFGNYLFKKNWFTWKEKKALENSQKI